MEQIIKDLICPAITGLVTATAILFTIKSKVNIIMDDVKDLRKWHEQNERDKKAMNSKLTEVIETFYEKIESMDKMMMAFERTRNEEISGNSIKVAKIESDINNIRHECEIRHSV